MKTTSLPRGFFIIKYFYRANVNKYPGNAAASYRNIAFQPVRGQGLGKEIIYVKKLVVNLIFHI